VLAQADSEANAEVVGMVSEVADADNFTVVQIGHVSGGQLALLTPGAVYYLDDTTPGAITATEPPISKPVLIADSVNSGFAINMRGLTGGVAAVASSFPDRVMITAAGFDEVGTVRGGTPQLPWTHTQPDNNVPFGTRFNENANDWIAWGISLRAGTYRLTIYSWAYVGGGTMKCGLASLAQPTMTDITGSPYNASNATVDTNEAGNVYNKALEVCDDLVIPDDGDYALRVTALDDPVNVNLIVFERIGA
jgi:hypothetical protein